MDGPVIVSFPGTAQTTRTEVGGKAASLIRMTEAGFPVPSGVVLTTSFFAPWFDAIKASPTWTRLTGATPEAWAPLCDALKARARSLPLTATQHDALGRLRRDLAVPSDAARFAVRSSSPEEDLTSASFAGGYDTRLGVRPDDLEGAVRDCFASSLDVRVLSCKKERGFDVWSPGIAVIVQRQIDSEVAGVAFSLNPLTVHMARCRRGDPRSPRTEGASRRPRVLKDAALHTVAEWVIARAANARPLPPSRLTHL